MISTIKHFSLNCNETNRHWLDAIIDPAAHRESDLLAFEIAIERAQPGSVMTGYNKVNGEYAGGNRYLLKDVLKGAWGYPGWVMSDWGATPTLGVRARGARPGVGRADRRDDVGRRAVHGAAPRGLRGGRAARGAPVGDGAPHPALDVRGRRRRVGAGAARGRHGGAQRRSRSRPRARASCCSKNDGVLPLATDTTARIAVIGGYAAARRADRHRLERGRPAGRLRGRDHDRRPRDHGQRAQPVPAAVVAARRSCRKLLPEAQIEFDPGHDARRRRRCWRGARTWRSSSAIRVEGEGFDLPDLSLPWGQDAVIDAVAVGEPEHDRRAGDRQPGRHAVARQGAARSSQAWYPGQAGGQAIAEVLTGAVNPSGRLPITFPADLDQTPRPELPGLGTPWGTPTTIDYDEGAEVGYRWFAQQGDDAALRLRPRPGLHELRVRRPRGRAAARPITATLHGDQHRRARRAPTCPSST